MFYKFLLRANINLIFPLFIVRARQNKFPDLILLSSLVEDVEEVLTGKLQGKKGGYQPIIVSVI